MTKIEVISQKPSKNWIFGKNGHFLTVFGQKWPIFEFFSKIRLEHFFTLPKPYLTAKYQKKLMNGYWENAWRTHVHTYIRTGVNLKVCLSARPKIEVISQKPSKTRFLAKKAIFWHFLAKKTQFWIFPQVPLRIHASRHLGEDFRKFPAKTNDKNWRY